MMASIDDLASTLAAINLSVNSSSPSSVPIDLSTNSIDTDHASNNCSVPADVSKSSLENSFHLPDTLSSSLIIQTTEKFVANEQQATVTDDYDKDQSNPPLSTQVSCNGKICNGDGSDSGVDIEGNCVVNGSSSLLQRALSSTSGGYSSSCGGLDEPALGNGSCNSSMISYCSELGEIRSPNTALLHHSSNQDCTSEGGSESSSITGGPVNRKASIVRKKVALIEPVGQKSMGKKEENSVARSRSRAASASRAAFQSKVAAASPPVLLTSRDRARSRDKAMPPPIKNGTATTSARSTPLKRPPKPDSLPSGANPLPSLQRSNSTRTPSISRRTPAATPTIEDGRWPTINAKGTTPISAKPTVCAGSSTPEHLIIKTKIGPISLEAKSPTGDKFATLPRRRKEKSNEDLRSTSIRSNSASRDRMTTSLIKQRTAPSPKETTPPKQSILATPLRRANTKALPKTKIYHETCVQTALTSHDIENAFAGIAIPFKEVEAIEMVTRECQVDIRDKQIERLQEQLCRMTRDVNNLQGSLSERSAQLAHAEQQLSREREEKQAMTKELQSNTQRILGMLANVQDEQQTTADESNCDSLLMLESQIQQSGYALEAKQCEIDKMYSFCRKLQTEMQRSMNVQQTLQVEKMEFEKESTELQDFLQDEKLALVDALREAEVECERSVGVLKKKDGDIERLQEECRHLVRISEQRRHEFLGMQSKYTALESRSKDLIAQQGSAVSAASMALTGLGSRLDQLVQQLIQSYSISEQELEDVIYHNEAYTNSGGSSGQVSPGREHAAPLSDGSLSPQRHQSFIVAVISAIRNAATTAKHSVVQPSPRDYSKIAATTTTATIDEMAEESDSTEMLESETEPCLMMENVLEDVSMPDTHSHNMISSTGLILSSGPNLLSLSQKASEDEGPVYAAVAEMNREEKSIHNLSQAILIRQQIEQQTNRIIQHNSIEQCTMSDELSSSGHEESIAEMPSIASEFFCAQPLVDQIIDVDNLVTKLLKVLRIIQMDNDNCIQQLIGNKSQLQLQKEDLLEQLRDRDVANGQLKCDLQEVTNQLMNNGSDLANSRVELQRHREEIDRLNEDICDLSTLCQNNTNTSSMPIAKEAILAAIEEWQQSKIVPEPELMAHIVAACQEIPALQEQLLRKEHQMTDLSNNQVNPMLMGNLQDAIVDTKRQYEAIDRALETLNSIQTLVKQCPALASLQRDLEETNFQSATTIPIYTALLATKSGNQNNHHRTSNSHSSDFNANSGNIDIEIIGNGEAMILNTSSTTSSNNSPERSQRIDSTA